MDRKYKGQIIRDCAWADGEHNGKYVVQTYHAGTGMPWSDEECPHYWSLAQAREAINESIKYADA